MTTADALFEAIHRGDAGRVRAILESAPELVNVRDGNGDAPLHVAACPPAPDLVRLLLSSGAAAGARNGEGLTPLQVLRNRAEASGDPEPRREVERLLSGKG